tara:strand:- start:47 stop:460 length:414 start_codon:yes stop_codon:yes gene_type:complete
MAQQNGALMLLKIKVGSPLAFQKVGGLRDVTITQGSETVSANHVDTTNRVRTLLEGIDIKSTTITASGVFVDDAQDGHLQTAFEASTFSTYQITVPDFKTYEGKFQLTNYEFTGNFQDVVTFNITLESAGAITVGSV